MNQAPIAADDRVYVHDPQFAWLPARVLEVKSNESDDETVLVAIELDKVWETCTVVDAKPKTEYSVKATTSCGRQLDGEQRWVNLDNYWNRQLPRQNQTIARDMADLPHLSEAAILYQIKNRHAVGKPYTRVGEIIVAVNPCQWIDSLYTEDQRQQYAKNLVWDANSFHLEHKFEEKKDDTVIDLSSSMCATSVFGGFYDRLGFEPHVYEASALAYRGMIWEQRDQIIVVSGESGAGKTETVKIVVRHLATLDRTSPLTTKDRNSPSSSSSVDLVDHVVQSSPIFEAFGNAKTFMNDNSSRFGKVTRLHYQPNGDGSIYTLAGSSYETHLLEKSRVVAHAPGERSFHIFYQLLSGDAAFKRDVLGPEWTDSSISDFRILGSCSGEEDSGICGRTNEMMLADTMTALHKFGLHTDSLRELSRALGVVLRLGNIAFSETEELVSKIENEIDLKLLACAIGIEQSILEKAFTSMTIRIQTDTVDVPLSLNDSKDSCHAFSKCLYAIIFEFIVDHINEYTAPSAAIKWPGYQISLVDIYGFESFETNRFEQLCINYANEKLQHKYVHEKLIVARREYEEEGIEMFDTSTIDNSEILELIEGELGVIECLNQECVRRSGSSQDFVFNLKDQKKFHECLLHDPLHRPTEFGIVHYAGAVCYQASDFVERNADKLPRRLLKLGELSTNSIIKEGFVKLIEAEKPEDDNRRVSSKKRNGSVLDKFRSDLRALMLSMEGAQTRYIRCIKPNETMTPTFFDHNLVMKQTRCSGLVTAIDLSRETFPNKLSFDVVVDRFTCILPKPQQELIKEIQEYDKVQIMMSALFASYIANFQESNFTMPFACGKTRVYFRSGALEVLETRRHQYLSTAATFVQKFTRMALGKSKFNRLHHAFVVLQSMSRRNTIERDYTKRRASAVHIQSVVRRNKLQKHYDELRSSSIAVQTFLRAAVAEQNLNRKKDASVKIAATWRMFSTKAGFLAKKYVATVLAARWRYLNMLVAALEARNRRENEASTTISSIWRVHTARCLYRTQRKSATRIAARWHCYTARSRFLYKKECIYLIQVAGRTLIEKQIKNKFDSTQQSVPDSRSCILGENSKTCECPEAAHKTHGNQIENVGETGISPSVRTQVADNFKWDYTEQHSMLESSRMEDDLESESKLITAESVSTISEKETKLLVEKNASKLYVRTDSEEKSVCSARSATRHGWKNDALVTRLENQNSKYLKELVTLRLAVNQVSMEAENHTLLVENDFEERLADYEEEVLLLRARVEALENEKTQLADKMSKSEEGYRSKMRTYKQNLQKSQIANKDYLQKVHRVFEESNAARQEEAARFEKELEELRVTKAHEVELLKSELNYLRSVENGCSDLALVSPERAMVPYNSPPPSAIAEARLLTDDLLCLSSPDKIESLIELSKERNEPLTPCIEEEVSRRIKMIAARLLEIIEFGEHDEIYL